MSYGWQAFLYVGLGGALGAMARYGLNVLLQRGSDMPWGTLAANTLGCLIMGLIAHLVAASQWFNELGVIPDQYRLLFAVGFCGSFTTLSSLVLEINTLAQRGELLLSAVYLLLTVVGGFAAFWAGYQLARPLI